MRWRRALACGLFQSPWQKALVCIIPPSFTVMLCSDCPVSMPACVHEFLLRMCSTVRRRIPRPPGQLRSRRGRRHHDSWSWLHRVQQNLSFVIIPLKPFIRTVKHLWAWTSTAGGTLTPLGNIGVWCAWRIRSCIWLVCPRHRYKGACPSKPLGKRVVSQPKHSCKP